MGTRMMMMMMTTRLGKMTEVKMKTVSVNTKVYSFAFLTE